MANDYYISAGLAPNDTDESNTANTNYTSAGITPDDIVSAPSTFIPKTSISQVFKFLIESFGLAAIIFAVFSVAKTKKKSKLTKREFFNPLNWL